MRVFDSYYFNIIDKVSFGETMPYLEKMLSELGITYRGIGFDLYDLTDEVGQKAVEMFPALAKYTLSEKDCGLMSYTEKWREGEIYVDPADIGDITAMLSMVPQKLQFSFGKLVFGGVKWFEENDDTIAHDCDCKDKFPINDMPFKLNGISVTLSKERFKKDTDVRVYIEVPNEEQAQGSVKIIEKLAPYLGEPYSHSRLSVLTEEEAQSLRAMEAEERQRLKELTQNALPKPRNQINSRAPKLPHVADTPTLNKVFKGTGFEKQKGQPNWLSIYACTDAHGFLYEANIQRISCIHNQFRVWLVVSGYNFRLQTKMVTYDVVQDGESLEILKQFAEFCVKLSEEYGGTLAEKFGETPAWYYEKLT